MVQEYPVLVITDARDLSKNSGNPACAHPNLCPARNSSVEKGHFIAQNVFYQNCLSCLKNYIYLTLYLFHRGRTLIEVQGVLAINVIKEVCTSMEVQTMRHVT